MRRRFVPLLMLLLLGQFLSARLFASALGVDQKVGRDFRIFYKVASRLRSRQSLYVEDVTSNNYNSFYVLPDKNRQATGYLYTPLLAFLFLPLSFLSLLHAAKIWIAISIMALWLSVWCFLKSFRYDWRDVAAIALVGIVGFRFWPNVMDLYWGQFDLFILAIFSIMVLAVSRGKALWCGVALAVLIMLKTWLVGLVLWLLLRRHYRALGWTAATLCLSNLLMYSLVGWNRFGEFIYVTRNFSVQSSWLSQSIPGFIRAHFLANTLARPWIISPFLGYSLGAVLIAAVAAGFFAVTMKMGQRKENQSSPNQCEEAFEEASFVKDAWQLCFAMLCLLLILPLCHLEYFVFLLPLIWLTVAPPRNLKNRVPLKFQIVGAVIYLGLSRGFSIAGTNAGWKSLIPSLPFVYAMLLWGMHAAMLRSNAAQRLGEYSPREADSSVGRIR